MKIMSRILSALLALVLVISRAPLPAHAADAEIPPQAEAPEVSQTPETTEPEADPQALPELQLTQRVEIPTWVNPLYRDLYAGVEHSTPEFTLDITTIDPNATTYLSLEQAAVQLRTALKNREESVVINLKHTSYDVQVVADALFSLAMEHTGVPTEGDYILWQIYEWSGQGSRTSTTSGYNYTLELVMTYYTTAEQEAAMDTAVAQLLTELNVAGKSDYEKVCAVYDYICANITYDYENLEDTSYWLKHTAYAALIDKTAVCQGYAVLFYRLMLELNVDSRLIAGLGNGGAHGWNIVELGGLYYNVDSTWDAGSTEYSWFLKNTWDFVYHYRYLEYETFAFHNAYPMAEESYSPGAAAKKDSWIYAGMCGDDAYWLLERDGTLTIFGTGATYDYTGSTLEKGPFWLYWAGDIKKIVVEEGITRLGDYAFPNLTAVTSVTLPTTLTETGRACFSGCTGLKSITLPDALTVIGNSCFSGCTGLTSITLPDNLVTIEKAAFNGTALTRLTLPGSVRTIGSNAFSDTPIATLTLNNGLETIGYEAFSGCPITTLTIPASVISLQGFTNCDKLQTLILSEGVTTVHSGAFRGCTALKKLTLPSTLTVIEYDAFRDCSALTSLSLPEALTTIGTAAFGNCDGLTTVTIPENVLVVNGFSSCDSLHTVKLPSAAHTIGNSAFSNCTALKSIELPDTVTVIEANSFYRSALTSIALPQGLETIGQDAFSYTQLTSVSIPSSVVDVNGFRSCGKLQTLYLYSSGVVDFSAFRECSSLETVYLEGDITEIRSEAFAYCPIKQITIPATVTELSGFQYCDALQTLVILGQTSIESNAFMNCTSLTDVDIRGCVTEVKDRAFMGCSALAELTFPDGLVKIGIRPFRDTALRTINFLGNAPTFASQAFEDVIATATYPGGNATWTEEVRQNYSGYITWVAMDYHVHAGTLVAGTAATCTEAGCMDYYLCECGKLFADEACTQELADVTIPALGHDYVDGVCTRCGHKYGYVKFSSISTSLGGNIAMNFYVELSQDLLENPDAVMQFTFADKTVTVPLSQGKLDSKGRYAFSCPITSKNMTDPITAQVLVDGAPVGESKSMDVRTYCEWIIANSSDEKTVNLMKAMLNYGASAQVLFGHNVEDLANAGLSETDKALGAVDATAFAHSRSGEEAGIVPKSYTLLLDSETTIRVYFQLTGEKPIEDFTFTVDGVEVEPQAFGDRWYIECKNIAAQKLDEMHTFTCGGITITYGGLSYVNQVMTYYTSGATYDMASALYAYWQAAENYIA